MTKKLDMNDVLTLDTMLTPRIITFVYRFLLVGSLMVGLAVMSIFGIESLFFGFFMGAVVASGAILSSRLWCEFLIVLFRMNEALQELRDKTGLINI